MNKIKTIFILLFLTNLTYSQDVKMTTDYLSENQDMFDLLKFENIDFYKVKFVGKNISEKNYILIAKEM